MDFVSRHWGDLASVLGLALTIWVAWRAKNASEQARDAALAVKQRMAAVDTAAELSSAIAILHDITRLQRTQAWEIIWNIVLDTLRSHLVRSKEAPWLSEKHRMELRLALEEFRIIVGEIEDSRTIEQQVQLNTARRIALSPSRLTFLNESRCR